MEMTFGFERKIHVQKDVHRIKGFHEHIWIIHLENDLLHYDISIDMDMYKQDID